MDSEVITELIKKFALCNAVKFGGTADSTAVMSNLLGQHPELRKSAREMAKILRNVVDSINSLGIDEQKSLLKSLAPELLEREPIEAQVKQKLRELPNAAHVVMRFAPNPNGPPTLGSARGIVINSEYAQKYKGVFVLRFDDTDPQTKRPMPEAYEWYLEDCEWLQAKPDVVVTASDRMSIYYSYAEQLIQLNAAYVCTCTQEEFKQFKQATTPCPDRTRPPGANLKLWIDMLNGHFKEREAVLRLKTDLKHKNPALRDWICFRIINTAHPRGSEYRVWPTLDFESAIEDHLLDITHIIRGKDLRDSEARQQFLYNYLGWQYPITIHWGRISIHEFGKFSTSTIKKDIEKGIYRGWDDPRLPTLRALRRRGFAPEAIRNFMLELGVHESDISISLDNLYAENRKIIDQSAHRYFFVKDPIKLNIDGAKPTTAKLPLHPSRKVGFREIRVESEVFVSSDDINFNPNEIIRLKDLYNVIITDIKPLTAKYGGDERPKNIKIIHWTPIDAVNVQVLKPEGTERGLGERGITTELDNVVQFERYGFARIDEIEQQDSQTQVNAYFTHK